MKKVCKNSFLGLNLNIIESRFLFKDIYGFEVSSAYFNEASQYYRQDNFSTHKSCFLPIQISHRLPIEYKQ